MNGPSGDLASVGNSGYSWSSTPYDSGDRYRGTYLGFNATWFASNSTGSRGYGFPLRCLSE
ncbi:hypothetical protein [uncultured Rikenella sp.]|uniref:hypothetical protein n=1 Tax=uncultured Rikenella sp. TaxID=368003 RepID=UPI00272CAF84|nr:hypothetical protein [uncultured Rikenella sp.]